MSYSNFIFYITVQHNLILHTAVSSYVGPWYKEYTSSCYKECTSSGLNMQNIMANIGTPDVLVLVKNGPANQYFGTSKS